MTQFHEGQEVEVTEAFDCGVAIYGWRKAKIIGGWHAIDLYRVEFSDGSRGVFDAQNIRAPAVPDWAVVAIKESP